MVRFQCGNLPICLVLAIRCLITPPPRSASISLLSALPTASRKELSAIRSRRAKRWNQEEAGEHFTPREVVRLMANLVLLPVADQITDSSYLLYDPTVGTGGMLTVAENVLREIAAAHGKQVSIHL